MVDIQPKEDLDFSFWNLKLIFQYLDTGIAEANRNVSTDFSRSGSGPPLVLIFYKISFPITVFSSPPESGEVEYSGKKARKKRIYFFSISLSRELLKSDHNFLNKFMSTEQNLVSPILCIKKSRFFVRFLCLWGFLLYIKRHLATDYKA